MFKIWSIIILAVTMLFAGIAVMSLDSRPATPEQLAYTGTWYCTDGSGERVHIVYGDKSYTVRIVGGGGNTLIACASGRLQNGNLIFRNTDADPFGDAQPWAYVSVQYANEQLTVDGYSAAPRVFRRAPGSTPQQEAY